MLFHPVCGILSSYFKIGIRFFLLLMITKIGLYIASFFLPSLVAPVRVVHAKKHGADTTAQSTVRAAHRKQTAACS